MQRVGRVRGLARLLCYDEELQGISWLSSFGTYRCSFDIAFGVDTGAVCLIKDTFFSTFLRLACAMRTHQSSIYFRNWKEYIMHIHFQATVSSVRPTDHREAKGCS
jgi:hypothetical protein